MTHICVGELTIIGLYNNLSPGGRKAIIWSNAGILLIGPLGTNFSDILIASETFLFTKMHLKMSPGKCRLFCQGLNVFWLTLWQWASYQIRKIAVYACAGNVFPATDFKGSQPLVSDPGMHHCSCATHVPWCMSGSLTRGSGENVPGIPGVCATRNFTYMARGPWYEWNHETP